MANTTTTKAADTCTTVTELAATLPATADKGIQLYDLALTTKWQGEWMSDGSMVYSNSTTPLSLNEYIYYDSGSIPTVSNNLKLNTARQSAIKGVKYGIRHEECVVTYKDEACTMPLYIDPIVTTIHLRHPNSSLITDEIVLEHFGKSLSALIMNGSSASTPKTRLSALMRGLRTINAD